MGQKKCECEAGAPLWIVTFADLMSLLLTFFVLLLSFATMEEPKKYADTIIAFKGALGIMPEQDAMVQINIMPQPIKKPEKKEEEVARNLQRKMQILQQEDRVKVEYDRNSGLKISLPSAILYSPGDSQLKPDAYPVLNELGDILGELPESFFEIRGHTDNQPTAGGGAFRDNYDLSYARADSVARYLNQAGRVPMEQFEIVACGASQPVAPNTTNEGRQANRRVDLYVRGLLTKGDVIDLRQKIQGLTNQL